MDYALLVCVIFGAIAYLVGSIPTGAWFAKWWFGIDIRQHGSGNIGASNIARVLGTIFFIPIFLFDACKAYLMLLIGSLFIQEMHKPLFMYTVAALLLIGNAHSIFLRLRGGKGVATVVGIMLYVMPAFVGIFACTWVLLFAVTRKPFMASLGAMVFTTGILGMHNRTHLPFLLCIIGWLVYAHRANLKALVGYRP